MSSCVQVRVDGGILEGKVCENDTDFGRKYYNFQGIPYARPPIGDLRFKAPLPVEPWKGVKNATKDGQQCASISVSNKKMTLGSEDCLYLNVYTPKLPVSNGNQISFDLKPVMFFIYGGGFRNGSNSKKIFGPEFLLREDVIIVVINYRTGFLGFLNLEDSSLGVPGNAAFKDMILALKWVKNNIKNFNGDPNNVTVFGESAGGACVHLLMLSPLSKGLFHRAIAQSGCALNLWCRSSRLQPILTETLGIDKDDGEKLLKTLQAMSVEDLLHLQSSFLDNVNTNGLRIIGYTIEQPNEKHQSFLTSDPIELMERGDFLHIPFLLGFNSGEGMMIRITSPELKFFPEVDQYVPLDMNLPKGSDLSKAIAEKMAIFYFKNTNPELEDINLNYSQFNEYFGDNMFVREIYKCALLHSKSTMEKCYFYEMTLETSINFYKKKSKVTCRGACHADDLSYLFKTALNANIKPGSPEDKGVRRFCRLWANFAKYGNPNSLSYDNLLPVVWKPFTVEEENYLDIGEELIAQKNPAYERMKFWKELYEWKNVKHKL